MQYENKESQRNSRITSSTNTEHHLPRQLMVLNLHVREGEAIHFDQLRDSLGQLSLDLFVLEILEPNLQTIRNGATTRNRLVSMFFRQKVRYLIDDTGSSDLAAVLEGLSDHAEHDGLPEVAQLVMSII